MTPRTLALVLIVAVCCAPACLFAQPPSGGSPPPPPSRERMDRPPADGEPPGPQDRARLRRMIEERLDAARRQQERLERALKLMDEGATPDEVRAAMPEGRPGPGVGPSEPDESMGERPDRSRGGGGWRGRPEGDGPRANRPITESDKAAIREFIKATSPRMFGLLEELESKDPAEADRKLVEAFPRVRWLIDLRERDPTLYDLRLDEIRNGRRAMDAAREIVRLERADSPAPDGQRENLMAELRSAIRDQYVVRTQLAQHDLERSRARLEQSRQELEGRAAALEASVDEETRVMLERVRSAPDRPPGEEGLGPEPRPGREFRRGDRRSGPDGDRPQD